MISQLPILIAKLHGVRQEDKSVFEVLVDHIDHGLFDIDVLGSEVWQLCLAYPDDEMKGIAEAIALWMLSGRGSDAKRAGVALLRRLAALEFPGALFALALEYIKGTSIGQDCGLSVRLLKQALAIKHSDTELRAMTMTVLADSFRDGRGCDQDRDAAHKLYCEAAEMGNANAAFNAGLMFDSKKSLTPPKDTGRAVHYYGLGMKLPGEAAIKCRTNLGVLHLTSAFANADPAYGRALLEESYSMGDGAALAALELFDLIDPSRG